MTRTSAQRHNAKMERIFENGRKNNTKYAPLHAFQILAQMTEKIERVNAIQHSGGKISQEDWSELHDLTNRAKAVIEITDLKAIESLVG